MHVALFPVSSGDSLIATTNMFLPHTWTGLPRQAADEHFPRKERRFHQVRRPVTNFVRRTRKRGDCQQRVTSGYSATPCAQSPTNSGRCHHTSTNNRTTPVLFSSREHVHRDALGSEHNANYARLLGPVSFFFSFLCMRAFHTHTYVHTYIRSHRSFEQSITIKPFLFLFCK